MATAMKQYKTAKACLIYQGLETSPVQVKVPPRILDPILNEAAALANVAREHAKHLRQHRAEHLRRRHHLEWCDSRSRSSRASRSQPGVHTTSPSRSTTVMGLCKVGSTLTEGARMISTSPTTRMSDRKARQNVVLIK